MQTLERLTVDGVRAMVRTFAGVVTGHRAMLNRLNVYPVPDGDTGTNMSRTLEAVVVEMDAAESDMAATCAAISHGSLMGARGNSGVILSQIMRALATAFASGGDVTARTVADGLVAASAAAYRAVGSPIEGTILTVVRETAQAASAAAEAGGDLAAVIEAAASASRASLARTPDLLPALKAAGVVDAGGAGFALLLDAALNVVTGRPLPEPDGTDGSDVEVFEALAQRADGDVSQLRYEVMYFLDLPDSSIDDLKRNWGAIGDSIVVVGGDGLWNCHVHTNDVGAAIEVALDLDGRPRRIRVTDLFEEVAAEHAARERAIKGASNPSGAGFPAVVTAVVAVSSGPGLSELFGQLGVQGVVGGGQSLNPSTAELLAAVEAVNASQVIVLPNNKNIIAVAGQLDALTTKHVVVVPTRSMPEGLSCLVVYDPEDSADSNAAGMSAAGDAMVTGEVTQAVRDTTSTAGHVRTGDWIGLVRGEGIVAVAGTPVAAAVTLLEYLVTDDREIVSVITGADAHHSRTDEVLEWLTEHRPDVEVEVHRGGQPLYPYLFGVE